ncbi:MAG: hypothetical protein O2955_08450 [Planctomycetota bacterium]|nr:hypothetical protein [Planctomycetota bacterium]MDA1212534.1 hypothetical protein [Planctomycetota bacterium]
MLALIIGVGSFVHELDPKLHTFWRSRPISPAAWFWLKFAAGFFVLAVLYDVPYALLSWSRIIHPFWRSAESNLPILEVCFPILLHLLVYSIAVLAACVIRHSVYATILALCAVLAILLPPLFTDLRRIPDWLSFIELWSNSIHHHPRVDLNFLIAGAFVTAFALPATLLSAWLIKRDIALNT